MDGAVYEWRLRDFKREKENVLKGVNYSSVLATPDCKLLYAAGASDCHGIDADALKVTMFTADQRICAWFCVAAHSWCSPAAGGWQCL
jgi:hypothetical protein